jgi:hypothetical protein
MPEDFSSYGTPVAEDFSHYGTPVESPDRYNDDLISSMSAREKKRLDLLSEMAAAQKEQAKIDYDISELERQERSIGAFASPVRTIQNLPQRWRGEPDKYTEPLLQVSVPKDDPSAIAGVGRVGAGLLNTMFNPDEALKMAAFGGGAVPKLIGTLPMVQHLPEQVAAAPEILSDPSTTAADKVEAVLGPATMAGMLALIGKSGEPAVKPPPEFPGLPDVDVVARNRAAPGTVRPQEQQLWAKPEIEAPEMFQAGDVPFSALPRFGSMKVPEPVIMEPFITPKPGVPAPPPPKVQAETRGKMSFGAEAPTLLRTAVEQAEAVGLTKSAEAVKSTTRGESKMAPYREPKTPTPESVRPNAAERRAALEEGMRAPQPEWTEILPEEGQFPPPVGMPSGTLSRLQSSRIQAGKENVRSNVRNNPPTNEKATSEVPVSPISQAVQPKAELLEATGGGTGVVSKSVFSEAETKILNSLPVGENGGRKMLLLPDGTAIVGKGIHAGIWNKGVESGVVKDSQMLDSQSGFVAPDGRAWGVNGKPLPTPKKLISVEPASTGSVAESVASMTPPEFMQWARSQEGGFTTSAYKIGESMRDESGVSLLRRLESEVAANHRDKLAEAKKGNMSALDEAAILASKKQFFTEALESAVGVAKEKSSLTAEQVAKAKAAGTPADPIVSKLESMKFENINKEGQVFSLPHPDAIKIVGKQVWNDSIDLAIAAVKAGRTVAEGIEQAVNYLKKNVQWFDEGQIRANLDYLVKNEVKQEVPQSAPSGEMAMRKSSERATTAEMIPEPVQQRIATAPESFYERQSVPTVKEQVKQMSDLDLAAVTPDKDIYTASQLESANRLFKAGKLEEGYNVFAELAKRGTTMGQNINQFKLLDGTTPAEIAYVVNRRLKEAKKDPLTKPQNDTLIKLAEESRAADAALDAATEQWKQAPTPENAKAAEAALDKANAAGLELQKFTGKFEPRSTAGILKSVMQGNLLTPISETANLVGNVSFLPFRSGSRSVASALDIVDSFLSKKPREVAVQPIAGTVEAAKGLVRGAKQIPEILARGSGDTIKGETRAGLHPVRAWVNQFAKNPEMPTTGGKLTLQDRINLAIEGTFGMPAEAMLRGLAAGDAPPRMAAQARITAEQLKLKNVPRDQWSFAQKFPELFFDKETLAQIKADSAAAIFQRDSKTLGLLTRWLRGKGEWVDLAAATVAPYKLTPWNIIGEVMSFNPLIAFGNTLRHAIKKDTRASKLNAGKMFIGSAMALGAAWLYQKGLIAPSLDDRDEAQKARLLSGEVLPPNHINISGLERAMRGEDPAFRPGDETRDFFRSGGLAGSMLYMAANVGREFEQKPESNEAMLTAILRQSTLEQARFGLNQSFLQGVEGFLAAVKEGNMDNFLRNWFSAVLSIPLPNTLAAMSRSSRDYKPDFREEDFSKQVANVVKNRLGFSGLDDYLPLKRDFWGQPLRETPKDRSALFYHFFDVTKGKQVTDDPVNVELYRLWRKTADSEVIPSLVGKTSTFNSQTYPLDAAQQSRLAELVGTQRRQIAEVLVTNPEFHKLSDEQKVSVLNKAYQRGQEIGKALFWKEYQGQLEAKPKKAGFK